MVEVMKIIVTFFNRFHGTATFGAPNPATGHHRAATGDSQTLTGKPGSVSCGVTAPFSWCTQGSVCARQEFASQSCVSSGGSMVE